MNTDNSEKFQGSTVLLINDLLSGKIDAADFSIYINQSPIAKARNLFRDSLPKFSSNIKEKFTSTFVRYFFNKADVSPNGFWKFAGNSLFWETIKNFHDHVYTRNMSLSQVISFFERNLKENNYGLKLSKLEKQVLEKLENNPFSLHKTIAQDLKISQKKISVIVKSLSKKGIYLGSIVDYSSLGFQEFFASRIDDEIRRDTLFVEEISLFPKFKFFRGISEKPILDDNVFYVIKKKVVYNSNILMLGLLLRDWTKHFIPSKKEIAEDFKAKVKSSIKLAKVAPLVDLLTNCEKDYKRPNIGKIAKENNISVRTLFRIKSRLKEQGIIEPKIMLDGRNLMNILIISNEELADLLLKVPFAQVYHLKNKREEFWLNDISIFTPDFKYLYSLLGENLEIFQIMSKSMKRIFKNSPILPIEQKVYTS